MPSRAARWISAITCAVEQVGLAQPGLPRPVGRLISRRRVVDLEGVELAGRAVAPEVGGVDAGQARAARAGRAARRVVVAQLLLDAVGAERRRPCRARRGAPRRSSRRAPRRRRRSTTSAARLRHERAHVADRALDDDVDALHRDAAARRGVAADDSRPPCAGRARRLAGVAVDDDAAGHHVLGQPGAGVAVHAHASRAGSCRRSSSRRGPRSRPRSSASSPQAIGVRAGRVEDPPAARAGGVAGEVVQALVEVAQRRLARSTTSAAAVVAAIRRAALSHE